MAPIHQRVAAPIDMAVCFHIHDAVESQRAQLITQAYVMAAAAFDPPTDATAYQFFF